MATSSASKVRHLALVRAGPVYDDRAPTDPLPPINPDDSVWLPFPSRITIEPEAHQRWVACERPDERLRYGAYLCDCATCWESLERIVREHKRPGLSLVVVTEADRITTNARELLTQHELGDGCRALLWVGDDVVRYVYVGKGTTRQTESEAQYHWRVRAAREGRYGPRPRLEHDRDAVARHPASTAPTVGLSIRLPRELERRARDVAAAAELDLETWIVEALEAATRSFPRRD
jgi:hypothetical protein